MNRALSFQRIHALTEEQFRLGVFLTFLIISLFSTRVLHAATDMTFGYTPEYGNMMALAIVSPLANNDRHEKSVLMVSYLRKQVSAMMPGLPDVLRDPQGWLRNGMHDIGSGLTDFVSGDDATSSETSPLTSGGNTQLPVMRQEETLWVTPGYHHKGFTNDALTVGFTLGRNLFDNRLRLEMSPLYGQNCISARNYYGNKITANFKDTPGPIQSAKIEIGYMSGNQDMIDQGRGIDLHSEIKFNDQLGFQAGIRQNETSQMGNYALLQWKIQLN